VTLAGTILAGLERTLVPLDVLRRELYRAFVPWLGSWVRERDVRVGIHGVTVVLGSLIAAVVAPLWLLALSPVVLGVPHLVADLRYLVVRPRLHRRGGVWLVGLLVVLSSVMVDLRWGLAGVALVPLFARGPLLRRLAVGAVAMGVLAAAFWGLRPTHIVLGHAHNLVAVVLWMVLAVALHERSPYSDLARWGPTVAFLMGGGAILGGLFDPLLATGLTLPGAPSLQYHIASLAPGLDAVWATRWVVAFAYAQAVHYGLWLRVIPEVGRRRPSPRSWAASLTALRRDFGDRVLVGAVVLTVGIALWGLVDLTAARTGYLRLALFHGPMELAVLAWVCAEGHSVLRP
jgi:hypothetical protein